MGTETGTTVRPVAALRFQVGRSSFVEVPVLDGCVRSVNLTVYDWERGTFTLAINGDVIASKGPTIRRYGLYRAKFTPQRTDNLRKEAAAHIDKVFYWTVAYQIEEGPYADQFAMMIQPIKGVQESIPMGWVPECDLSEIEEVAWP